MRLASECSVCSFDFLDHVGFFVDLGFVYVDLVHGCVDVYRYRLVISCFGLGWSGACNSDCCPCF